MSDSTVNEDVVDAPPDAVGVLEDELSGLIERARRAAEDHDPWQLVEVLYEGNILDGLLRTLGGKWQGSLCEDDLDLMLAEAIDVLYDRLSTGAKILDPIAFLWKVADRHATRFHRERSRRSVQVEAEVIEAGDSPRIAGHPTPARAKDGLAWRLGMEVRREGRDGDTVTEYVDYEATRAAALATARSLVSQLGQERVQAVMSYVFDALGDGRFHVPLKEIAEAVDITPGHVSVCLNRGWTRLRERAAPLGLAVPIVDHNDVATVHGEASR